MVLICTYDDQSHKTILFIILINTKNHKYGTPNNSTIEHCCLFAICPLTSAMKESSLKIL
jgi:hypothetical protein